VNLDGCALPVKKLKGTDPVETLDLSGKYLGVASLVVIASLISVNGGLTVANLLGNQLDAESAKMLAEVAKQKGISLCGIQRGQTTADFSGKGLRPPDAILLASDLSQAIVTGGLTSIDLSDNQLCDLDDGTYTAVGITAIADAMRVNVALTVTTLLGNQLDAKSAKLLAEVAKQKGISLCGIQHNQTTAHFRLQGLKPPDAILLASDLTQAVVTGALTKLSLAKNKLGEEGTKFLCDALDGNNTLKELDLSGDSSFSATGSNIGGTAGAKHVANMLLVNGALTSINLRGNYLRDEGWGAIFAAICGNKASKIMSMDASGENISPAGVKLIAEALRTSVTGALTVTNLLQNQLDEASAKMLAEVAKQKGISLCGIRRDQTTADFSKQNLKPPFAILLASDLPQADVTGGLTSLNLSYNQLCGLDYFGRGTYTAEGITAVADALRVNAALTSINLRGNKLGGWGWGAIFAAICGNKDSKIMSMDASCENIGPAGVKLIAEALRTSVTGSLTSVKLRGTKLGDKGWGAIFAAICCNKDSKIMSMDASCENIGPTGVKLIAEALRTSVTGGLTRVDVRNNNIAGDSAAQLSAIVLGNLKIEMFNKIPIKEMRTDTFTELDLKGKGIGVEGGMVVAGLIPVMGALTEMRYVSPLQLSLALLFVIDDARTPVHDALVRSSALPLPLLCVAALFALRSRTLLLFAT
jgi:predicted double-glycine peptidase